VTVSVEFFSAVPKLREVWLRDGVSPVEGLTAARVTVPVNPFKGSTDMIDVPIPPEIIVKVSGVPKMPKSAVAVQVSGPTVAFAGLGT
jgi:hypothetical protein